MLCLLGKVRAIGVSNFSIKLLDKLLPECSVIPAVNQVQLHPCWPQEDLRKYCADREILLTAYSPFGILLRDCLFELPTEANINHGRTIQTDSYGKQGSSKHRFETQSSGNADHSLLACPARNQCRPQDFQTWKDVTTVICESHVNPYKIAELGMTLDFLKPITLSDEDMNTLNSLYKQPNMHRSLFDYPGFASTGKLIGWAPEQLGWPLNNEGLVVE